MAYYMIEIGFVTSTGSSVVVKTSRVCGPTIVYYRKLTRSNGKKETKITQSYTRRQNSEYSLIMVEVLNNNFRFRCFPYIVNH